MALATTMLQLRVFKFILAIERMNLVGLGAACKGFLCIVHRITNLKSFSVKILFALNVLVHKLYTCHGVPLMMATEVLLL